MPAIDLPKAYAAHEVEDDIYVAWEASGFFDPDRLPDRNQAGEPYCIMLPPPNRTGTLHMGHATMLAIEDLMIRFQRLQGKKTLWVPGTDHAPIATQVKVEQLLINEGMAQPRQELGREAFVAKVVAFAEGSRQTINKQMRKMGCSCDWSRECYTFDAERSRAVYEMFKRMYEDGVIERGARIVNWDPKLQTNISDDEIEWKEERAPFYTFQYGPFQIGTSRPETKFGDKHVVMHPDDARYRQYRHGDQFTCEWINGPITATVIKDAAVDPAFGTGVMTITPWHDAVDFALSERHGLPAEQVIDLQGKLLPIAAEFAGLSIEEARPKIVDKLKRKGLLVSVDGHYSHRTAHNYRGGGLIEPQIMRQWFVRVNKKFALRQATLGTWQAGDQVTLKELMAAAVASGQITIIPERFVKTYFYWIDQLRDWCISRQIWFGHRIPIWYRRGSDEMVCAETAPGDDWEQDADTLDTWFSSGTWTFSALGWPDEQNWSRQRRYHPTAVLETGYDILFFWVARMILMSTYALGEAPFRDVYLHGLVRDEQGRKMSKSLGNIIDPLDMIPKYGTDAVRLSLVMGTTPGQDTKLSESKIEGFRNFANKLWNISRFILLQIEKGDGLPSAAETLADGWLLERFAQVTRSITEKLSRYEFSAAGEALRDFTWGDVADWYLEIAKVESNKGKILTKILKQLLILWHPFMPFVTEHIWQSAGFEGLLMVQAWPASAVQEPTGLTTDFERLREYVSTLRQLRLEQGVAPSQSVEFASVDDGDLADLISANLSWISRLSGAATIDRVETLPLDWPMLVMTDAAVAINAAGTIDVEKERQRLQTECEEIAAYVASLTEKLANGDFTSKAPERVVQEMRQKLQTAKDKRLTLEERLKVL